MIITSHHIVMRKDSQRNLNDNALINNNAHILGAAGKSIQARGWKLTPRPATEGPLPEGQPVVNWSKSDLLADGPDKYRYELHFTLTHTGQDKPGASEHKAIVKAMHTRGTNPLGGRWSVHSIDGVEYEVSSDKGTISTKDFVAYADFDLPLDFETPFDHLYGLDSHIARIRKAMEIAILSQFEMRYHVALIGPPGCGKSDICETLADMFGDDAVMKFDGTQTTAAGAIKQIDEAEILPRVMVVEEIEKVAPEALSYLLALMDTRGEIRKTTARKQIAKDTKILVVATVNNVEVFDKIMSNALSSRFSNKCWFKHPDEATITRILTREIAKIDGDTEWIGPVVAYAREKQIHDPRMLIALCMCGRDGWLDGSYHKMLADTDKPQDYTN
jgi:adenylate kinase family enzyme